MWFGRRMVSYILAILGFQIYISSGPFLYELTHGRVRLCKKGTKHGCLSWLTMVTCL